MHSFLGVTQSYGSDVYEGAVDNVLPTSIRIHKNLKASAKCIKAMVLCTLDFSAKEKLKERES
jgi:hypothetical protein